MDHKKYLTISELIDESKKHKKHLTISELINELKKHDGDKYILFDFLEVIPCGVDSLRWLEDILDFGELSYTAVSGVKDNGCAIILQTTTLE